MMMLGMKMMAVQSQATTMMRRKLVMLQHPLRMVMMLRGSRTSVGLRALSSTTAASVLGKAGAGAGKTAGAAGDLDSQHDIDDGGAQAAYKSMRLNDFAKFSSETGEKLRLYENKFSANMNLIEFISKYQHLEPGHKDEQHKSAIVGRIQSKRDMKKWSFVDITEGGQKVQAIVAANLAAILHKGDIIGVRGYGGKSKKGELSIFVKELEMLAPQMHLIPDVLIDQNVRYRSRHIDLLTNKNLVENLKIRNKVVRSLRNFLDERDFVEVETPILWSRPGGATARPFVTRSNALQQDLHLRIAPELFLKRLVIGGLDRVYEIGKVFRNEGIDASHSPEFTSCEFYQAYSTYKDLMEMTQQMMRRIANDSIGATTFQMSMSNSEKGISKKIDVNINLDAEFQVIDILPTIQKILNMNTFPDPNDEASIPALVKICESLHINTRSLFTCAQLIDRLISHLLEPLCTQPTFLIHHPTCLSPLAKSHSDLLGVTERFELYIAGSEICNAYSELNDPTEQRKRLENQLKAKQMGDEEACSIDEDFCNALEYGLPPTAGWGMGIDRFCMMLTNTPHIRDVLSFPIVRDRS